MQCQDWRVRTNNWSENWHAVFMSALHSSDKQSWAGVEKKSIWIFFLANLQPRKSFGGGFEQMDLSYSARQQKSDMTIPWSCTAGRLSSLQKNRLILHCKNNFCLINSIKPPLSHWNQNSIRSYEDLFSEKWFLAV